MAKAAAGLATPQGYSGYGAEQGQGPLREALAKTFYPGARRLQDNSLVLACRGLEVQPVMACLAEHLTHVLARVSTHVCVCSHRSWPHACNLC